MQVESAISFDDKIYIDEKEAQCMTDRSDFEPAFRIPAMFSKNKAEIQNFYTWYIVMLFFLARKNHIENIPALKIELTYFDIYNKKHCHYFTANCINPQDVYTNSQLEFEMTQCNDSYVPISTD